MAYLVRQSLSGQAPLYLADDCCLVSDSTRRSLRSADVPTCVVPRTHSSYGDRAFASTSFVELFRSSCAIQTSPTDCSDDSWRDTFFREAWTRRSVTSGALEKHLLTYLFTYLLTFLLTTSSVNILKTSSYRRCSRDVSRKVLRSTLSMNKWTNSTLFCISTSHRASCNENPRGFILSLLACKHEQAAKMSYLVVTANVGYMIVQRGPKKRGQRTLLL